MKSIRIGNDIRIEWPLKLSGNIEKLEDLDLCVEVVPSKEIIDYNNYDDKPGMKVETCTVMLNGGKCKVSSRDALKAWHDRKRPEMSPIILPFTISENKIIAIWKAGDQYSVGEYDIIVYSKKNDIGQTVADQCRFVRLVAHSAQADAPADSDVEAIITLQPLTLELSGLSAYDIAVAEGFEGTRKEWLDSLKSERLGGYKSVESIDELPQEGEGNIGYIVGTRLYLYVGAGGDTLNGKYKDAGEFKGPAGADGMSAYEVAVEKGFAGTVDDWLKSLQGANGENGTSPIIRIYGNRFEQSTDNGKTWSALSDRFDNRLYIKGYVNSVGKLPKNALMGDIYGVGPIYMDGDNEHTKPYYQIYVNTVSSWNKNYTITKVYQGDIELPQSAEEGIIILIKKSTDNYLVYKYINGSWNLLANLAERYVQKDDIINRGDNIYALVQSEVGNQYDLYERFVSWQNFGTYNSISAGIVQKLGDGENVVMSQKGVKNAIINKIDLSAIDLDRDTILKITGALLPARYVVTQSGKNVGSMVCFSDNMGHVVTQVLTTHYTLPLNGSTHSDEKIFTYWRNCHLLSGGSITTPVGSWGEWALLVEPITDADIDEIIPPTHYEGGEDEGAGGGSIDAGQISELKAMIDQNTADIAELQANGSKSVGNYILISVTGKSDSGDARNTRIVSKEQLTAIQDYVDKLEAKYPSQYQFNGTYIVREYNTTSTYLDMIYNKMQIYHVGTYYRMTITAQDINMSPSADTGKGRMIIKGIEFAFDTQNMPDNLTTYVKEAQCDVISVPEQELAQDGDMKYKNVYKVLTNDGTYKEISDLLGVDLITNGNGDKFLADNGQYVEMHLPTYTLIVISNPGAQIKINGVVQSRISVTKGTEVTIEVSLYGYYSKTEKITVNENITKEILLEKLPDLSINREELEDMKVYKIWAKQESGKVKFDTTNAETIKSFLTDINAGNIALLYMTQPMPSEASAKDYVQMMLMSFNATQFTAIGYYQTEEIVEVGSISQYLVTVKSDNNNGYTATYSTITANLKPLDLNTAYNIPLQFRTSISSLRLSEMSSSDLEEFISEYNNLDEMIPKGKCYLTITKVDNIGGSPTEVPFDIYPDVYNKKNIGGSGVILHGISRNADTHGRRLELEITGDTGSSRYYTISKCRYVDNSGSPTGRQ